MKQRRTNNTTKRTNGGGNAPQRPTVQPLEPRRLLSGVVGDLTFDLAGSAGVLIGSLEHGDQIRLGLNASQDGAFSVDEASFYLDVNADGMVDAGDILLGTDTNPSGGFTLTKGVSHTWGTGDLQFLAAVTDNDTNTTRTLTGTATINDAAPAQKLDIYDADGDRFTFILKGTNATMDYTYDATGYITEIIVSGTEFSSAKLKVKAIQSETGDGRLLAGAVRLDDTTSDADPAFRVIDLRPVDLDGAGFETMNAGKALLGNVTGTANLAGSARVLIMGDVDTTSSFTLLNIGKMKTGALSVGGGITVKTLTSLQIGGDANFDLDILGGSDEVNIRKVVVDGNASGEWEFYSTTQIGAFLVRGNADLGFHSRGGESQFLSTIRNFRSEGLGQTSIEAYLVMNKIHIAGDFFAGREDAPSWSWGIEAYELRSLHVGGNVLAGSYFGGFANGGLKAVVQGDFNGYAYFSRAWSDRQGKVKVDIHGSIGEDGWVDSSGSLRIEGDVYGWVSGAGNARTEIMGSLIGGVARHYSTYSSEGSDSLVIHGDVTNEGLLEHIGNGGSTRIEGVVSADSRVSINRNGILATEGFAGLLSASIDSQVTIDGAFTGIASLREGAEFRVTGNVDGAEIWSVYDMGPITLERNVRDTQIVAGQYYSTYWRRLNVFPETFDDFYSNHSTSTIDRLEIGGTATGLRLAAPTINFLDINALDLTAENPSIIRARTVGEAHFTTTDGTDYDFDYNKLFDESPALPYLELTQL